MAVQCHVFPQLNYKLATGAVNFSSASIYVALVASSSSFTLPAAANNAATQAMTTMTMVWANAGSAISEHGNTGTYSGTARVQVTSPTIAIAANVVTLSGATASWAASTLSAVQAVFYTGTASSADDGTNIPISWWDFGATQASAGGAFSLPLAATGLATWTAA